jgi:hypothetical protein
MNCPVLLVGITWKEIVITVHATNGFGGFVAKDYKCILDAQDAVDVEKSKAYVILVQIDAL